MFVHQGTYDDFLGGEPAYPPYDFFDEVSEPPQRCPSHIAGPKFWCPPSLQWSWTWSGGGANFVDVDPDNVPSDRPNQVQRRRQCWASEMVKNSGDGCAAGTIMTGSDVVGCHLPECRRGCSTHESVVITDDERTRISPWRVPRATPWGCGHCVDAYPVNPYAE